MAGRIAALVAVLLAAGCGSGGERRRVEPTPQAVLGPGRLVDIGGGRSLYLRCSGSGSPTVVLEAGYGATTDTWSAVEPALGRITRTCAYDRAGLGNSTAIPGVHDAGDEVADLSRLLQHAGVRPPYVVVGHSYGGLLARLFAGTNRGQVGGVVLVDPIGSDFERRLLQWWRSQPAAVRRKLPRPKPNAVTDGVDFAAGAALARRVESLGDLPLVLISRGLP